MSAIIRPTRRAFFLGAASLLAAPSIVRAASLMPVKVPKIGGPYYLGPVIAPLSWQEAYVVGNDADRTLTLMAPGWSDGIKLNPGDRVTCYPEGGVWRAEIDHPS